MHLLTLFVPFGFIAQNLNKLGVLEANIRPQGRGTYIMKNYNFPIVELKYVLEYKPNFQVSYSLDSYHYAKSLFNKDTIALRESFFVIFLNRSNYVTGYFKMSEGGTAGTVIDMKLIFQAAILHSTQCMIVCHNHPSGNIKPSCQDITITNKIKNAAKLLDITLLDHIIVTPFSDYYSFADEGAL